MFWSQGITCVIGLSQTSTVDERWTSLNDKLLQATEQACGVFPKEADMVVEQPGGGSSKGEMQVR